MCNCVPIRCDGFSVAHEVGELDTQVAILSPSRRPKNGTYGKYCINAGKSLIEVDGVASTIDGTFVVVGVAGDCRLVVVDDDVDGAFGG